MAHRIMHAWLLLTLAAPIAACSSNSEEGESTPMDMSAAVDEGTQPVDMIEDDGGESEEEMGADLGVDMVVDMPVDMRDMTADMEIDMQDMSSGDEDAYRISAVREENGQSHLYVFDTAGTPAVRVTPDPSYCATLCVASADLSALIYLRAGATGTDLWSAPIGTDGTVMEQGQRVAEGVEVARVSPDVVTYRRTDGGDVNAYAYITATGQEQLIATSVGMLDSWWVEPTSGQIVLFQPTLQTLGVVLGTLGDDLSTLDPAYTFPGYGYQDVGGSYYGPNQPAAFRGDGRYLATHALSPNAYNACSDSTQCDQAVGQHCGSESRCVVREQTVYIFDVQNAQELGTNCVDDTGCAEAHRCDIPDPNQLDQATCAPGRVVLGYAKNLNQPRVDAPASPKDGCGYASSLGDRVYTIVRGPLAFDEEGDLVVVGERDCPQDANIPLSDILSISPVMQIPRLITGNVTGPFDPSRCYDSDTQQFTPDMCALVIERALPAPVQGAVAFAGTNPNVVDSNQADQIFDLYSYSPIEEARKYIGDAPIFATVRLMGTHPPQP